jgi:ubiquinone/menaquinone biosynthesis C-methylase UbiE
MTDDKKLEEARYDQRGTRLQAELAKGKPVAGADSDSLYLKAPYTFYEMCIRSRVSSGQSVLEIGAGTGEFTVAALRAGATVTATDISQRCLEAMTIRLSDFRERLKPLRADMEALPFDDESFDSVISSGSLSYGDNSVVVDEIYRVIKRGGCFICVDSLNHNPIYKINRLIQSLLGKRTVSTVRRMPTVRLIELYSRRFGALEVRYFGAVSWAMPLVSKFVGDVAASKISDYVDQLIGVERSAFKFVMIATKLANRKYVASEQG